MNLEYYILRDGRWLCVFVPDGGRTDLGELTGNIYNLRRRDSHKRVRVCADHLFRYRANQETSYSMWESTLVKEWTGPFVISGL